MKKQFLFAALAMTALFTACSNEDDNLKNENEGQKVTFVIGGVDSRTTTDANFATTFDKNGNEKVGIFSSSTITSPMNNDEFTVDTDGKLTSTATYTYGDETAYFNAYYPYQNVDGETTTIPFTINSDQRTNFGINDFIIAKASGTNASPEISLNFNHALAFVQIELNTTAEITSATMNSVKSEVTFTPDVTGSTNGSVTTNDNSNVIVVSMYKAADKKYWAIIPAQTCTASKALFSIITNDGKLYTFKPSSDVEFSANKVHKYKLSITASTPESSTFSTSTLTVLSWSDIEDTPETAIEITETALTTINPAITQDFVSAMASKSWDALKGEDPIWAYNTTQPTLDEETNSIKLVTADNYGSGWYRGLIYYSGTNNLMIPGKSYKLTFSVKATNNNSNQGLQVTVRNAGYFYDVNNGNPYRYIGTTSHTENFSTAQTTVINASQWSTANSGTINMSASDAAFPFYIIISPRTKGEEYYIKDIRLMEVTE
jgi:hypothetical protein